MIFIVSRALSFKTLRAVTVGSPGKFTSGNLKITIFEAHWIRISSRRGCRSRSGSPLSIERLLSAGFPAFQERLDSAQRGDIDLGERPVLLLLQPFRENIGERVDRYAHGHGLLIAQSFAVDGDVRFFLHGSLLRTSRRLQHSLDFWLTG